MGFADSLFRSARTCLSTGYEIAFYWQLKSWRWFTNQPQRSLLLETLTSANEFEEWEAAAVSLDVLMGNDVWRQQHVSKSYNYALIHQRLQVFMEALDEADIPALHDLLRSGLARNLGGILTSRLYERANAGTKVLIEAYVAEVNNAIREIRDCPSFMTADTTLDAQSKLTVLHDTRLSYGRSVLVLQGGSIFGLCHLGIVKALHLRGLLPRIIAGSATGALMASLVGVRKDEELLHFLSGHGMDLSAFADDRDGNDQSSNHDEGSWFQTLWTRTQRFLETGFILDVNQLKRVVRANIGDATFEEAYERTGRILNITISTSTPGSPTLLNYITAPNVLIWTAALASNAIEIRDSPVPLQCKLSDGSIALWDIPYTTSVSKAESKRRAAATSTLAKESPLTRLSELFNVNHFIVSQARPYIAPFLTPSIRSTKIPFSVRAFKLLRMEFQHRLGQLNTLGFLPLSFKRLVLDEQVPGSSLDLVPEVSLWDFARFFRNPTPEDVNHWILRGERSVWPNVVALTVRLSIEFELENAYQLTRRRDRRGSGAHEEESGEELMIRRRKRKRAKSFSTAA
ncbi:hypothetical protein AMS68_006972 [Peltaster fructicola]|uniref:PNPLA domain-containing protein n=1 Tax=Peltaster fructicola TaxID=286661 RepID=A0A6H0Y3E5_9PEZI|nr:hypothetical protein AMS68_006972 [Peltaster fructicola]